MMNRTAAIILFSVLSFCVFSQNNATDQTRFITVTGSAEISVEPDEIQLNIEIVEYAEKAKKVILEDVEAQFFNILASHNITKDQVIIGNAGYYWYYWWYYRKENFQKKSFIVSLDKSTNFFNLVQDLNVEGVASLRIGNTTNKRIQSLRKEVKMAALVAAKEKATYLLESIDEQLGSVLSVEELNDSSSSYYWRGNQNLVSNVIVSSQNSSDGIDHVANIKLRYEIRAKFEIAD